MRLHDYFRFNILVTLQFFLKVKIHKFNFISFKFLLFRDDQSPLRMNLWQEVRLDYISVSPDPLPPLAVSPRFKINRKLLSILFNLDASSNPHTASRVMAPCSMGLFPRML